MPGAPGAALTVARGAAWETPLFLGCGSNLGDRWEHLQEGLAWLSAWPGMRLEAVSSVYESPPMGPVAQGPYLNLVAAGWTTLPPLEVLEACLAAEQARGRVRGERWGPRTLDVDILLLGEVVWAGPQLTLPHPGITERAFVLVPLAELVPDWVVFGRKVRDWCAEVPLGGLRRWQPPEAGKMGCGALTDEASSGLRWKVGSPVPPGCGVDGVPGAMRL